MEQALEQAKAFARAAPDRKAAPILRGLQSPGRSYWQGGPPCFQVNSPRIGLSVRLLTFSPEIARPGTRRHHQHRPAQLLEREIGRRVA